MCVSLRPPRYDIESNVGAAQNKSATKKANKKRGTGKKWSKAVNQPNIGSKYLKKKFFMAKDKEIGPSREHMGNCPQTP
jgi:hypothetical protein